MASRSQELGPIKYGVMLFSISYLSLTMIASIYIGIVKGSLTVVAIAVYCYIHVCASWRAMFYFSNKDFGMEIEEGEEKHPLNFCNECNIFRHKLSHHCPLCKYCVLRRDHHCFFLGTCIGLNNQSYFLVICLYNGLGSLYLSLQIFLISDWVFNEWYDYIELFIPFGCAIGLIRATSMSSAFLVVIYNFSVSIGIFCICMFFLQVYLVSCSVTWHQFNSKTYNSKSQQLLTAWANFKSTFGRYGLLNFVIPVIPGLIPPGKSHYRRVQV